MNTHPKKYKIYKQGLIKKGKICEFFDDYLLSMKLMGCNVSEKKTTSKTFEYKYIYDFQNHDKYLIKRIILYFSNDCFSNKVSVFTHEHFYDKNKSIKGELERARITYSVIYVGSALRYSITYSNLEEFKKILKCFA
ncbi:gp302 [Bacillus phage G]|uniref:Gp302 n=1 Tax=Bacillus phage G TaxID=2884420 RepID=G3MA43_9CAUD|nr:gp302 [Bacillus phage G]AEO93561.1 gp302 [Bacillus phage G]